MFLYNIIVLLTIIVMANTATLPETTSAQPIVEKSNSFEAKLVAKIPENLPEKVRRYLITKARALGSFKFSRIVNNTEQQKVPTVKKPLPSGQQQQKPMKAVQPAGNMTEDILKKPAVVSALESVSSQSAVVNAAVLSSSVAKPTTQPDKNWLMTKAWLIDNINRLHHELSQLERSYATDLTAMERTHSAEKKQLMDDIEKLRQDQTLLATQQRQMIFALKRSALSSVSNSGNKISKNDIHYTEMKKQPSILSNSMIRTRVIRKRDTLAQPKSTIQMSSSLPGRFQRETTRNMQEVYAELSSLHDITLGMIDCMKNLEHRVELREQFSK